MELLVTWFTYSILGAFAGILAGLLGVGGGIVIVPMLTFTFVAQQFPHQHLLHLALGTSLATIVFTSIASFRAHHRKGAVNWQVVRLISPGIVVGTLAGSWVAASLSTNFLKIFFVGFTFFVALQMLLDIRPKPHRQLPGGMVLFGSGSFIGAISSLVGIGGGSMSVPLLVWCNVPMHGAIGTSAAIGFPIAISGAVGYILNGLSAKGLPAGSFGFVYLPALIGVAGMSFLTAPLGARLAHRLPVSRLKKLFACLLIATGLKLLSGLI
jgi:uncharacterized membrane protein YfcA